MAISDTYRSPPRPRATCEDGWLTSYRPQGLWCLKIGIGKLDYNQSQAQCETQGGVLSGIQNDLERQIIANETIRQLIPIGVTIAGVWLGASKVPETNTFQWNDGHTTGTGGMFFGPGQPDNALGDRRGPQNCLQLIVMTPAFYSRPDKWITFPQLIDDYWCHMTHDPPQRLYACGKPGPDDNFAGFAGSDFPPLVFPSNVGESGLVGLEAFKKRFQFGLTHPIKNGIISDWNSMEIIWDHVFTELNADSKEHPVFLTESPLTPKKNREKMTQIMFETFNTPAMYVAMQPVMSLLASGRITALVVDSGYGATYTVPVYDEYAIPSAICRMELSGGGLTEYLQRLLTERGYYLTSSGERRAVQEMKEKLCYVARNFANEMKPTFMTPPLAYELPDGQFIKIRNERFRCSEALFKPAVVNPEFTGIPKMVSDSILKCDGSIRKELWKNISLSGGTTCLPGFENRFVEELKVIAPKYQKVRITKSRDINSAWMGGSILALSHGFDYSWVLKEEYHEVGPSIVHRKCF